MFFLTYVGRELRHRVRQAIVIAVGLALGVGLVITVTALSSGVRDAQGKVLGALYGVGTNITVTTATRPTPGGPSQVTPEPYVQHTDTLGSPTFGTMNATAVTAISRLRGVAAAVGGLVLTEIKATLPADNAPPSTFQPPVQVSVVGTDVRGAQLGPLGAARLIRGKGFRPAQANAHVVLADSRYAAQLGLHVGSTLKIAGASFTVTGIVGQSQATSPPELYIPLELAQALARLRGDVNSVYVEAASAAAVGTVSDEISRLMPSATVTNSDSLAKGVTGALETTAQLASRLGTWLAVLALIAAFTVASLLTLAAVARRAREFGTLKALGWPGKRISVQVMGETIAMGIAGAAAGVVLGISGALLVSRAAPDMSATVQTADVGKGSFGGSLGAGGGIFHATVGGPVETFANPNATHTVAVPFSAPVSGTGIVVAIILAIAGALIAGSVGGWHITRLRPSAALARVD